MEIIRLAAFFRRIGGTRRSLDENFWEGEPAIFDGTELLRLRLLLEEEERWRLVNRTPLSPFTWLFWNAFEWTELDGR